MQMNLTTSLVDLVSTNVRHQDVHLYKCLQVLQSFSSFNHNRRIYKGIHIHSVQVHSIHQDNVHSIHTRDQLWDQLQLRAQPQLPSSFCHRYRGIHIHSKDIHSHSEHSSSKDQPQHWVQLQLLSSFCHSSNKGIHIHNDEVHNIRHSIHTRDQLQPWGQPQLPHWDQPLGLHRQMPQK